MPLKTNDNLTIIDHPILARDVTILRDKDTSVTQFRRAMKRASTVLAYHALQDVPLQALRTQTPIKETTGYAIDQDILIIPILRAGLGLTDAVLDFVPDATVGHLGMYRDEETLQPVDYYSNIPQNVTKAMTLVVDPMLATGGSADDALSHLKAKGANDLHFISLISAPEGISLIQKKHPEVSIITAAVDEKLNDDAYIVPGLGDAGDRYFGTSGE